jgi:hypothetical protein
MTNRVQLRHKNYPTLFWTTWQLLAAGNCLKRQFACERHAVIIVRRYGI